MGRNVCWFGLSGFLMAFLISCAAQQKTPQTCAADDATKTSSAQPGKLPKAVLKSFAVTGITPEEGKGIEGKFCVEISKSKKLELVCADDLKILMEHQTERINLGMCDDEDCLAKIAQAAQADFIIKGSINRVGEVFSITTFLVDGKTGTVKTRFNQDVKSSKVEDLLEAVTGVASQLTATF